MQQNAEEIKIDPIKLTVTMNGKFLDLPLTQMRMLSLFLNNKGKVLTRRTILASMHSSTTADRFSNLVDVYVAYLRRSIGKERIITVRGEGYMFKDLSEVVA